MARKDEMKPLHILVSESNRTRINKYALSKGFKVTADYIRELIERDMQANGEDINLSVDRGGYRERKTDEDEK